jgi:hypothetical protein
VAVLVAELDLEDAWTEHLDDRADLTGDQCQSWYVFPHGNNIQQPQSHHVITSLEHDTGCQPGH